MAVITLLPSDDIYIAEWYPDTNLYQKQMLYTGQYQQPGDDYRSLLRFNLDQLPVVSTILNAEIELFIYRNEVQDSSTVSVHRILDQWLDTTVTWNGQPLSEEESEAEIQINQNTPFGPQYLELTSLVQDWNNGSIPNNGIMLRGNEMQNSLVAFRSHYYPDSRVWPRLKVSFVNGILNTFEREELKVPCYPDVPLVASNPVQLGPRKQATFLVKNLSDSPNVKVRVQVGYSSNNHNVFFDDGNPISLKINRSPGEAVALSTYAAAEYARVLVQGCGGERVAVYARTKE